MSAEEYLGDGWKAKLHRDADGLEVLVLFNERTKDFINLPDDSVKRLRGIFATIDRKKAA